MSKNNKKKLMSSGLIKCPIDGTYEGPLVRHHIHGRKVRKWDDDWNIVFVSPNTHQLIHEGLIILEGWFQTTNGRSLMWHRKGEESLTGRDAKPHLIERK
jgi:hypothetical protein